MQNRLPDFFLGSSEHRGDWARVRACWLTGKCQMEDGRECVLVDVSPPVVGQPFGLGDKDIVALVLVPRRIGTVFTQKINHDMPVLVYRVLNPQVVTQHTIPDSDIELSAWCEIYSTFKAAEKAGHKSA